MPSPGGPPPSDPTPATQDPESTPDPDWRPEDPGTWGERPQGKDEWRPESPDTWERIIAERRKERGFRRSRQGHGGDRRRSRRRSRSKRSSGDRGLDLNRRSRSRKRRSSRHNRRRRIRRIVKITLLVGFFLLIGVGVAVGDAYYQSYKVYEEVRGLIPRLTGARVALASGDVPPTQPFDEITAIADHAQEMVESARFTFRLTGALPIVNRPVKAVTLAVGAMKEESTAAGIIRDLLADTLGEPVESRFKATAAPIYHGGQADIELIQSLPPRLEELIVHLKAADQAISGLPHIPLLEQLDELRATASVESKRAIDLANGALTGARLLPTFLGADGPRTYFFAMQNNSDQRATGGAVLAYALIRANKGKIDLVGGGGITDVDKPFGFDVKLPPEVQWYIDNVEGAYPRIANPNFSPDFPASARAWEILVPRALGQKIDGVIGIDPVFMGQLLGQASIDVPSYPDPITGENAVLAIENQQYLLTSEQQRAFPGELIGAAWQLLSNPPNVIKAGQRLGLGLRSKRMQIWSKDASEEKLLTELGWDGSVQVSPGDYLYVTDSKLLANKVDYYTHPSIEYDVKIQANGGIKSTVTITLDNRTPSDLPNSIVGPNAYALNKALVGAYVPKRAKLVSANPEGGPPVHTEGDASVFLRIVKALPDNPGVVRFTYSVPDVIDTSGADSVYRLRIQHQPMVNLAAVTVKVTLPDRKTVTSAPGWTVDGSSATYQVDLDRDIDLEIHF